MANIPGWLEPLIEKVAAGITVHGPEGALGLGYREGAGGVWDVLVYALPVEMVGGAHDGDLAAPGFALELEGVRSAFTRLDAFGWDAHGSREENTDSGPCVSLQGEFAGRTVWLRILAYSPADVKPAVKVDPTGRRLAG